MPDADEDAPRVYLVVRADLDMPAAKAAGQAMHAMEGLLERADRRSQSDSGVRAALEAYRADPLRRKIALKAKSLEGMRNARAAADEAGVPAWTQVDAALTVFSDETETCFAFGPVRPSELPKKLARLRLA